MSEPNRERAAAAWGEPLPAWVAALARACDAGSQAEAGRRIGYSGPTVNQVLARSYPGNLAAVERAVRGAFLAETVDCPVLGQIPTNTCQAQQRRRLSTASPQQARLYRACKACPHRRKP